jgi:OmpA-OmpF porin, OOP family
MKRLTLLLGMLTLCFVINVNAQTKSKKAAGSAKKHAKKHCLDAGIMGGVAYYNGELHCPDLGIANLRPGGGAYFRYGLNDNFFMRLNGQFGQIEGADANFEDDWRKLRNFSFSSIFYDAALLLEWEPFGKYRYKGVKNFNRMLSPYIHTGIAGVYSKPKTNYNEPNPVTKQSDIGIDKNNTNFIHLGIPVGGGVRYDLNQSWMIGVEGGIRVVLSDYLDGVSIAGNPGKRDWYETLNLTLGYRLPCKRDKDGDGIADEDDVCPNEAGTAKTKGCADRDNDGVADKSDNCPDEAGTAKTFGCPDTDGDGIIDKEDNCPNEKGSEFFKGCPDTDGDGISDKEDKCPEEKGTVEDNGCPVIDTDKDGIPDKDDKCPEVAGILANLGCPDSSATLTPKSPSIDSTSTGLINSATTPTTALSAPTPVVAATDANRTTGNDANSLTNKGVANTTSTTNLSDLPVSEVVILDENGKVASSSEKKTKAKSSKKAKRVNVKKPSSNSIEKEITSTPSSPTAVAVENKLVAKGSPSIVTGVLSSEDEAVLKEAVNGIYFNENKATLKSESYAVLIRVAKILKRYPNYAMRITGHTDDIGGDLENVKLSVARARAIYNYLLKKGIDISNLSYRGCGSGNPADENTTAEGRAKNRRVEFDMMSK